jgi:hypothetical protein
MPDSRKGTIHRWCDGVERFCVAIDFDSFDTVLVIVNRPALFFPLHTMRVFGDISCVGDSFL